MINKKWDEVLKNEFTKDYYKKLGSFVKEEYSSHNCWPKYNHIFEALKLTDYDEVLVVILGQDPYHGQNEAHGLSFSVQEGVKRPPSLNNIFKELYDDLGIKREENNLTSWAKQGVLLLNAVLTVREDTPLSHKEKGWEIFTNEVIKKLNERNTPIIFVLWGSYARSKKELINNPIHHIIESAHPSPLSANRGFMGSKPFSKINYYLEKDKCKKIDWSK